jgi:hypothetical protein
MYLCLIFSLHDVQPKGWKGYVDFMGKVLKIARGIERASAPFEKEYQKRVQELGVHLIINLTSRTN